ncbi:MAG: 3-hydroxybutyryl-CoA dehydrogenase [Ignavibacteriae bacterium]|nr:3-hydroxybutyryl-CoA dehydrogenase [Ignavibacteriota bacterium]
MNQHMAIGILGGGAMGRGIAIAALLAEKRVTLFDAFIESRDAAWDGISRTLSGLVDKGKIPAEQRDRALSALRITGGFDELVSSSIVIEAVPESLELKKRLFADLSALCDERTIFASNTSSLSITVLSTGVKNPSRVAGMHFFNPAHLMKLVEVVAGRFTSDDTIDSVMQLARELGKTPVETRDTPGFIVNRVARPFYTESLRIAEERVADIDTIDRIVRGHGFRMGPFELMDFIGHDVNYEVTRSLYEAFNGEPRYRPSFLQKALVEAGLFGRKSGRGFYTYDTEQGTRK